MSTLTAQRLRELLDYDPETGIFTRRTKRGGIAKGGRAGAIQASGHRRIMIDGVNHYAQRLVWLYMKGVWPVGQTDHKNCAPDDNRFDNLREATVSQNQRNSRTRRDNACGLKGVYFHATHKRWIARIRHAGRQRQLGHFRTAAAAHAAYCKAAMEIDPEFARFA